MSQEQPQVIQGRLGIESGDITELRPEELAPHPKNDEIYGDTDDASDLDDVFVESVREKGVLEPLVITDGKQIISGHRRWLAAKATGAERVPVRKTEFDSDLAEREALIEFNRQREKTPGQIVNEFEEMLAIEQKRAEDRKQSNLKQNGRCGNISTSEGKARDKAAEKVNADVSGRTLEKGLDVKQKAESEDEPEEVRKVAKQAWEGLNTGEESFHSAQQKVKDAKEQTTQPDTEQPDDHSVVEVATKQETDEWSSPRSLVEPIADTLDGFDLDPCSGAEQSPFASETYTESDNGLVKPWYGDVWVNPPYSDMSAWTEKTVEEADHGDTDTIIYLCKGDTSTQWWHHGATNATLVVAIEGRLSFGDGGNAAPFASHLLVFGEAERRLRDELSAHGLVLTVGEFQ